MERSCLPCRDGGEIRLACSATSGCYGSNELDTCRDATYSADELAGVVDNGNGRVQRQAGRRTHACFVLSWVVVYTELS